jgi:hypothetical protein
MTMKTPRTVLAWIAISGVLACGGKVAPVPETVDASATVDETGPLPAPAPIPLPRPTPVVVCSKGTTECLGACVDLQGDDAHCGACGIACGPGTKCVLGLCTPACMSPDGDCGAPDAGRPAPACDPLETVCQPGPDPTSAFCAALDTDPANCGACGHACSPDAICAGGACILSCNGRAMCGGAGAMAYCADLTSDPANCGGCGQTCSFDHAKARCVAGACSRDTCDRGFTDCDANAANGCECAAAACVAGACGKRVFLTSQIYDGDLGGLAGADAKCQMLADAAALGGTYLAWLSDSTSSPLTRFHFANVPYVRVDGTVVALDAASFRQGALLAPIDMTETGGPPPQVTVPIGGQHCSTWSNSDTYGSPIASAHDCADWHSTTGDTGHWGDDLSTTEWSTRCYIAGKVPYGPPCAVRASLYCFEQ